MTRFNDLDPILHSQLRLAVISLLMNAELAEFKYIQEQTNATAGNLSVQITRLKEAGYLEVIKKFNKNYPQTLCRITPLGKQKFIEYVKSLKEYLDPGAKD